MRLSHVGRSWSAVVRGLPRWVLSNKPSQEMENTLMATYAEMIQQYESKRRDAERRLADAKKMADAYVTALETTGWEKLTPEQERMADDLMAKERQAKDDLRQ